MSESGFCVYQFSGTGNTRHAAGWLVDEAAARGLAARSVDLKHARDAPLPSPDDTVGIATPVHGFTAPWHVIRFASRIPRGRGSRAFVMTTRAGLAFGRFILPGIGGTSTFLLALILSLRGYRVSGVMSVDMPSNWFSLHPIQRPHTHRRIVDASEQRVRAFARRLLDGRRVWVTRNNLYELVWGLALVPVSLGYLLMGRFFLAKLLPRAGSRSPLEPREAGTGRIGIGGLPDAPDVLWADDDGGPSAINDHLLPYSEAGEIYIEGHGRQYTVDFGSDELEQLADRYGPAFDELEANGQPAVIGVWRVRIAHFSAWDCNWGRGCPPGGCRAPTAAALWGFLGDFVAGLMGHPDCARGSIIECENQVMGQAVPLHGTDMSLVYRSSRAQGYRDGRKVQVQVWSGPELPDEIREVRIQLHMSNGFRHRAHWRRDGDQWRNTTVGGDEVPPQIWTYDWPGIDG